MGFESNLIITIRLFFNKGFNTKRLKYILKFKKATEYALI